MAAIVSALTNAYHLYSNFGDFKAQLMEGITQLKTGTPEQNLAYLATKYNELQGIFTQAQAATHEMQEVVTEVEEIEKTCMGIERSLFAQTSAHGATGTIGVVGTAFSMFTNDVNSVPWLKEVSVVLIVVSMVFAFKNSRDFHQAKQAEKTKNAYLQETKNKLKQLSDIAKLAKEIGSLQVGIKEVEKSLIVERDISQRGAEEALEVAKQFFLEIAQGGAAVDGMVTVDLRGASDA